MNCPYCSNSKLKVTDKRSSPSGIRRRRECLKCGKRFTTYEKIEMCEMYVVKKDRGKEKFDREKLSKGINKAFEKRPLAEDKKEKMINDIEEQLRKKGVKEIKSSVIGEMIMKKIKKVDNIAYLRFASVYKNFQDVQDFKVAMKQV